MSTPTGLFAKRPNVLAGTNLRALAGPILICMILGMMILPLPPMLLDLLFTFNIALSVMVLLVSMYTMKPLDFAAFPSVLLFSTLLRLSLNVASTRVVLLEGHTGPDAAGQVIEAFGHFLVGGNFAVGIVVFVILMIINFMVITKGAGRIAEVSARFTLDAMPGKQMAIDADLNAGLINEEQARKRRLAGLDRALTAQSNTRLYRQKVDNLLLRVNVETCGHRARAMCRWRFVGGIGGCRTARTRRSRHARQRPRRRRAAGRRAWRSTGAPTTLESIGNGRESRHD